MNTRTELAAVLPRLVACAAHLAARNCPSCCWDDQGPSGHWSSTLDAMEGVRGVLARMCGAKNVITGEAVTCLSLSRAYGPTPTLSPRARRYLEFVLFPAGNPCGRWYTWEGLERALRGILEDPARASARAHARATLAVARRMSISGEAGRLTRGETARLVRADLSTREAGWNYREAGFDSRFQQLLAYEANNC